MAGCNYPVCLNVADKKCLVVGGGGVAERKVHGLLAAGARVTVVSPILNAALQQLQEDGRVEFRAGTFVESDLVGVFLVIAATDDRVLNREISLVAKRLDVLVNVADDAAHSSFTLPAVLRRGDLQVAVSTNGRSPALAKHLRDELEAYFTPDYAALLELAASVRLELAASGRHVSGGRWTLALDEAVRKLVRQGELEAARSRLTERLEEKGGDRLDSTPTGDRALAGRPENGGFVSLVGAGPGDPGLISVRGLERLRQADAILYDRLVDPRLLAEARPDSELIYAGKVASMHALRQPEINRLLVALAKQGKLVVRLKGGDPFVFGRGGEEAEALAKEGISFEVVPGISSATAVPAYAGIPLTHRQYGSSFAVVTGWEDAEKGRAKIPWHKLATGVDTLVFLMGVGKLGGVVDELLQNGRAADTPVAVIRWGTLPQQATITGVLGDIVARVESGNFGPPAVVVVGDVVRLREVIHWIQADRVETTATDLP